MQYEQSKFDGIVWKRGDDCIRWKERYQWNLNYFSKWNHFVFNTKGVTNKRRLSRKSKDEIKPSLDPSLSEKLDEVIDEGILDSVLPFLCNSNNTAASTSTFNVAHTCPAKSKTSASTINIGTNVLTKPDVPSFKSQSETVVAIKNTKDTHTSGPTKLRRKSVLPPNLSAEWVVTF